MSVQLSAVRNVAVPKPLTKFTDDELGETLERISQHVQWSYSDVLGEMTRRSNRR